MVVDDSKYLTSYRTSTILIMTKLLLIFHRLVDSHPLCCCCRLWAAVISGFASVWAPCPDVCSSRALLQGFARLSSRDNRNTGTSRLRHQSWCSGHLRINSHLFFHGYTCILNNYERYKPTMRWRIAQLFGRQTSVWKAIGFWCCTLFYDTVDFTH